jgi:hypothetical protein
MGTCVISRGDNRHISRLLIGPRILCSKKQHDRLRHEMFVAEFYG